MSSDQEWYYSQNGQRFGPVSADTVRSLLASNSLHVDDYVWRDGMANWEPASAIPELASVSPYNPVPAGGYTQFPGQSGYTNAPSPMSYYTPPAYAGFGANAGFWLRVGAYIVDTIIVQVGMESSASSLV